MFANANDPAKKKTLCMALRHIAHMNGADLVFGSVREKQAGNLFRSLLNHYCFDGGPMAKEETNPNNPIHMPAGADRFKKIGEPDAA